MSCDSSPISVFHGIPCRVNSSLVCSSVPISNGTSRSISQQVRLDTRGSLRILCFMRKKEHTDGIGEWISRSTYSTTWRGNSFRWKKEREGGKVGGNRHRGRRGGNNHSSPPSLSLHLPQYECTVTAVVHTLPSFLSLLPLLPLSANEKRIS